MASISILSQNEFTMIIEEIARDNKQTHIEAVLQYCADNYIDPTDIAKMIEGSLKDKIRSNFVDMDMITKTANLGNEI